MKGKTMCVLKKANGHQVRVIGMSIEDQKCRGKVTDNTGKLVTIRNLTTSEHKAYRDGLAAEQPVVFMEA